VSAFVTEEDDSKVDIVEKILHVEVNCMSYNCDFLGVDSITIIDSIHQFYYYYSVHGMCRISRILLFVLTKGSKGVYYVVLKYYMNINLSILNYNFT